MKRFLIAVLASASTLLYAQQPLPAPVLPSTIVNALVSADATPRKGFTRLRVGITSNEPGAGETIRIAGMEVCSASMCYQAGVPSSVNIFNTSTGTSTTLVEMEVPYIEITAVRFKAFGGQGLLQGAVTLTQALKLEEGFKGYDILVVAQKRPGKDAASIYEPIAAVSNYLPREGDSIYYNPKFATSVKLPLGLSISIPAGALQLPQIFLAGVLDTGGDFPKLDIYPALRLNNNAKVQMSPIKREPVAQFSERPPLVPSVKLPHVPGESPALQRQTTEPLTTRTFEINSTGIILENKPVRPGKEQSQLDSTSELSLAAAATANDFRC